MLLIGRSTNDRKTCESQVVKAKDIGIVHSLAEVRTPVPDCKGIQIATEYDNRRLSRPSRECFPLAVLIHKQITAQAMSGWFFERSKMEEWKSRGSLVWVHMKTYTLFYSHLISRRFLVVPSVRSEQGSGS